MIVVVMLTVASGLIPERALHWSLSNFTGKCKQL